MASCVVVTAYTCLLLGFLAVGFGFFAPFWVQYINDGAYEGLWGRCRDIEINVETGEDLIRFKCVWFHEDDFGWEKSKPGLSPPENTWRQHGKMNPEYFVGGYTAAVSSLICLLNGWARCPAIRGKPTAEKASVSGFYLFPTEHHFGRPFIDVYGGEAHSSNISSVARSGDHGLVAIYGVFFGLLSLYTTRGAQMEYCGAVWFLACQVLDAFGFVTVFAILFVASIHLCCSCCKESISLLKAMGVVLIFGVCMLVSALGAFAGMSYRDHKTSINSQVSRFDWGFYVDIPGVVLVLLSALLYLIESCRYEGYQSGHNEIV
ncbi:hypothetical protein LSH36_40g04005 [Paralvinella palmiformis]|uniref:Uncharacterized protein n=1 Tax=Paralvinella palmiformis TaxID=53620 RepID=A0AAD9K7P1_9ANNE|nr:hypothetical protein LSH36_40g04005 [Paralvinella palmiformis]